MSARSIPSATPTRRSTHLELSAAEHRAKRDLLTQPHASRVAITTDAVVLEQGETFLLTDANGDVPFGLPHGLGLYFEDCRFLNGFTLALDGNRPVPLSYEDGRGFETIHHLANPEFIAQNGLAIPANTIAIRRHRVLHDAAVHERITFVNHGAEPAAFAVELRLRAGFEDIFAVKQFVRDADRPRPSARWIPPDRLVMRRRGVDGVVRRTRLHTNPAPSARTRGCLAFAIELEPRKRRVLSLAIAVEQPGAIEPRQTAFDAESAQRWLHDEQVRWETSVAQVASSSRLFDRVMRRAVIDLQMLRSSIDGHRYFAAGIPWFATLFGRDSALVAMQSLPYRCETARDTLRLLARYQASSRDAFRDAAPGKILHELRRGELARSGRIPQSPAYYGSVDATMLFLILLCEYVRWSGDLALARELAANVERALAWMDEDADADGDGFLDYSGAYSDALVNQGWKDSGNAIADAEGELAKPPIALCEVQGYAYRAWREVADLWRTLGAESEARKLDDRARELQRRFERHFWSESLGCYLLARQAGGRPVAVASSNAGQVLWSGIAARDRAARVVERLLAPDMFSGWGIRTLSSDAHSYNPMGYHLGSVWPHDNALILAGFRRYGHDDAALRIFDALFDAAASCRNLRLPELFCGYPRADLDSAPVPYPVACSPQAWAAGALPYALWTLLGLDPDAQSGRLFVRRSRLPQRIDTIELRNVRVGEAVIDLHFERSAPDAEKVECEARMREGEIEVIRDEGIEDPSPA